jgi:hypothetical protein
LEQASPTNRKVPEKGGKTVARTILRAGRIAAGAVIAITIIAAILIYSAGPGAPESPAATPPPEQPPQETLDLEAQQAAAIAAEIDAKR